MFHTGDITSGISKAVQEQKFVACFVREDDDAVSTTWEDEWLARPLKGFGGEGDVKFGELVAENAVLLRLTFGSQEANFLNAFTPITNAPTIVVIRNGQVLEKIESDVTQGDFILRLSRATGFSANLQETKKSTADEAAAETTATTTATTQSQPQPQPAQETISAPVEAPVEAQREAPAASQSASPPPAPPTDSSADMSSLFPDRAARLAADQARREAALQAERRARATLRRKESEAANADTSDPSTSTAATRAEADVAARRDWLIQQKQRKDEAAREKARILAQIEADKADRKARAAKAANRDEETSSPLRPATAAATSLRRAGPAAICSLQIRLFDGRAVKGRFDPRTTTLAEGVRKWVAEQQKQEPSTADSATPPDNTPYTFRQILAPAPNRTIEVSEEHKSLEELDLAPTATLVLVPVPGAHADAYAGAGGGVVGAAAGLAWRAAGAVWSLVPGWGGSAGEQGPPQSQEESHGNVASFSIGTAGAGASRGNVKTLADQRAEAAAKRKADGGEAEFYNGNSLGFAGRKGEDRDSKGDQDEKDGKGE